MTPGEIQLAGLSLAAECAAMAGESEMVGELIKATSEREWGGNIIAAALLIIITGPFYFTSMELAALKAAIIRKASEGN